MNSSYLLMWLEGPLQSWGFESLYGKRDSLEFPTKSGIIGIILSALGYFGEQEEFLKSISSYKLDILSFRSTKQSSNFLEYTKLTDFQVVGNGYDPADPWENLFMPRTSNGTKPSNNMGSKLTYRKYLQNACFAAIMNFPQNLADQIGKALQFPIGDLSLGRKNCVPSEMIFQGIFQDNLSLEEKISLLSTKKHREIYFRVTETTADKANLFDKLIVLNDVPLRFGLHKKYSSRTVGLEYTNTFMLDI